MAQYVEVRCIKNDRAFFVEGYRYWLVEKHPDFGSGYHVYVGPNHNAWICNISTGEAKEFFGV